MILKKIYQLLQHVDAMLLKVADALDCINDHAAHTNDSVHAIAGKLETSSPKSQAKPSKAKQSKAETIDTPPALRRKYKARNKGPRRVTDVAASIALKTGADRKTVTKKIIADYPVIKRNSDGRHHNWLTEPTWRKAVAELTIYYKQPTLL